jgi:hypothetical protein
MRVDDLFALGVVGRFGVFVGADATSASSHMDSSKWPSRSSSART